MPSHCAVAGCRKVQFKGCNINYHRFPKDKKWRMKWVEFCKRSDNFNPATAYICSRHFETNAYERNLKYELLGIPEPPTQRKFRPGATPTLYSPHANNSPVATHEGAKTPPKSVVDTDTGQGSTTDEPKSVVDAVHHPGHGTSTDEQAHSEAACGNSKTVADGVHCPGHSSITDEPKSIADAAHCPGQTSTTDEQAPPEATSWEAKTMADVVHHRGDGSIIDDKAAPKTVPEGGMTVADTVHNPGCCTTSDDQGVWVVSGVVSAGKPESGVSSSEEKSHKPAASGQGCDCNGYDDAITNTPTTPFLPQHLQEREDFTRCFEWGMTVEQAKEFQRVRRKYDPTKHSIPSHSSVESWWHDWQRLEQHLELTTPKDIVAAAEKYARQASPTTTFEIEADGDEVTAVLVTQLMKENHQHTQAGQVVLIDTTQHGHKTDNSTYVTVLLCAVPASAVTTDASPVPTSSVPASSVPSSPVPTTPFPTSPVPTSSDPTTAAPLGIIFTSSQDKRSYTKGLCMLRRVLDGSGFCGHGRPQCFIIDGCVALKSALRGVWPGAALYLGIPNTLREVWRWLIVSQKKNSIKKQQRLSMFRFAKELLFAESKKDFDSTLKFFSYGRWCNNSYVRLLSGLLEKKTECGIAFGGGQQLLRHPMNIFAESGVSIIKDIVDRGMEYNIFHLAMLMNEVYDPYMRSRIETAAKGCLPLTEQRSGTSSDMVDIDRDGDDFRFIVLSGSVSWVRTKQTVDVQVGVCDCRRGIKGDPCHHITTGCMYYLMQLPQPHNASASHLAPDATAPHQGKVHPHTKHKAKEQSSVAAKRKKEDADTMTSDGTDLSDSDVQVKDEPIESTEDFTAAQTTSTAKSEPHPPPSSQHHTPASCHSLPPGALKHERHMSSFKPVTPKQETQSLASQEECVGGGDVCGECGDDCDVEIKCEPV